MDRGTYVTGVRPYGAPESETLPLPPRSDEEIRADIVRSLQLDPWVNEQGVDVRVSQGVATLEGEVDVFNEKRAAGDDAWDTAGVLDVNNNIRVRKPERLNRARRAAPGGRRAGLRRGVPEAGAQPR